MSNSPKTKNCPYLGLVATIPSCAYSRPFLAIFGSFLGHILEVEGNKGLFVTRKSRCTCSVVTVCLLLAVFSGFWGRFGPKKADLGHKMSNFGRAPPDVAPGVPKICIWHPCQNARLKACKKPRNITCTHCPCATPALCTCKNAYTSCRPCHHPFPLQLCMLCCIFVKCI